MLMRMMVTVPDAAPGPDPTPQPRPARGLLLVITGASGVGKGTLRERWLAGQDVFYSTSWTTREARPGERDGVDYVFVTPEVFLNKARQRGFLEHAQFVGNHYGTPIEPIEAALARGQDVVLEIEVEGAMQVKDRLGDEAILIFIMPPSLTELRRRLTGRATETPERIEKRLARAREEIMHAHDFRYVVVNDDLDRAVEELRAVQQAERARQRPEAEWTEEDRAAGRLAHTVRSAALSSEDLRRVVES
ncbi:guanylate kinase [Deinococcus sp. SDU3-2]|uniref:Guanylate kinase n=2 Tax=Deinococcus terrestris TaxID=2651870 RepID=A0A7X1NX84_9DEIO|nr:guanylate kinase [Deinococcus terrestris]